MVGLGGVTRNVLYTYYKLNAICQTYSQLRCNIKFDQSYLRRPIRKEPEICISIKSTWRKLTKELNLEYRMISTCTDERDTISVGEKNGYSSHYHNVVGAFSHVE